MFAVFTHMPMEAGDLREAILCLVATLVVAVAAYAIVQCIWPPIWPGDDDLGSDQ